MSVTDKTFWMWGSNTTFGMPLINAISGHNVLCPFSYVFPHSKNKR